MKEKVAWELAATWLRAHQGQGLLVQDLDVALARELQGLLADEAQGAVGHVNGATVVIAVDGGRFIWITASESGVEDRDGAAIVVRTFALDQSTAIRLDETIRSQGEAIVRARTWTLGQQGRDDVALETEELLIAQFQGDTGPSADELVAREIARRVGWPIPEEDA